MLCPSCRRGRLILRRIEYRGGEVVHIYVCEKCGFKLEVSYRFQSKPLWIHKYIMRAR